MLTEAAFAADTPTSVSLDRKTATMLPGDKLALRATVSPQGVDTGVKFVSSNKKVATVDSSGVVTAIAAGKAQITVTTDTGKKKAKCAITVKRVAPTSVSLQSESTVGKVGEKMRLSAKVLPEGAYNKAVTYKSSNSKIASVNSKGIVTLKKIGDATITATTKAGKKKAQIKLSVRKTIEPASVKLSVSSAELSVGKTLNLRAEIEPSRADDKSVSWSSSDSAVAKVSASGVVSAVAQGSVKIAATTNTGAKIATCSIKVESDTSSAVPNTIALNCSSKALDVGQTFTLIATVGPALAAKSTVEWSSSSPDVAKVDSNGKVTAISKGTATITAKTSEGSKKATCKVNISKSVIKPTSVKLNTSKLTLEQDQTYKLEATISPTDATNKAVGWSTSNSSVAAVSSEGKLSARAPGTAQISVKTKDGELTAICSVTVTAKPAKSMYHALLIGQENYSSKLYGPANDVKILQTVLKNSGYADIRTKSSLTAAGIRSAIGELSSSVNIGENDVTLFFYSGHGGNSSSSSLRGALIGVDGSYLRVDEVRQLLDKVPGKVIIVLDSCLSGQFITSKSAGEEILTMKPEEFNQCVIDAFSDASSKAIPDSSTAGKYVILTAAESLGYSYSSCVSGYYVGLFSYYFGKGAGYDLVSGAGGLLADSNGNKKLTLDEMYAYISKNIGAYMDRIGYSQKTQMWPTTGDRSKFVLLDTN